MKRRQIRPGEFRKIASAESFQHPAERGLRIGEIVQLNSGGPKMMVVDIWGGKVGVAWIDDAGRTQETDLPPECVHRVSPIV